MRDGNSGRFRYNNRRPGGDDDAVKGVVARRGGDRGGVMDFHEGEGANKEKEGWRRVLSKKSLKLDVASKFKGDDEERKKLASFFFTNFLDPLRAWDMFHLFSIHGRVVEVVIAGLKEGWRKRFGFVRFLDVKESERMATKLDNIFIRGIKLHVNLQGLTEIKGRKKVDRKLWYLRKGFKLHQLNLTRYKRYG